jgi:hypothetical protein
MVGIATLLVALTLALVITRVATVALRTTGLSHEASRFQARSAFSGVGFTTAESEDILSHPARRQIVLTLMMLSSAGIVTTLASLVLSFAGTSGYRQPASRLAVLALGLVVLWRVGRSDWVDARLSRLIERGLARWTTLDARDYVRLLHIHDDYSVSEIGVDAGEWLEGRPIGELQLAREGVVVLGIHTSEGGYIGAPTGHTLLHQGDTVLAYGRTEALEELDTRRAGPVGNQAHERGRFVHRMVLEREAGGRPRHHHHPTNEQEVLET